MAGQMSNYQTSAFPILLWIACTLLIKGRAPHSHLLLVEMGFFWIFKKNNFLKLTQENEWLLFAWKEIHEFPRSHFLHPQLRRRKYSWGFSKTRIRVSARASFPCPHSPTQHQSISPSVHVCWVHMATSHTGKCKRAKSHKRSKSLFRGLNSPKLSWSWIGSTHFGQSMVSQAWLTGKCFP